MPFLSALPVKTITLQRGTTGLGFYIRGGLDIPHTPGDPGIFVTRLLPNGAAAKSKELREGDKIVSINGRSLEQVMHADAVRAFMFAGDTVKLEIQQAAYSYLMSHFAWAVKNTVRELWPASWFIAQYVVDYNITVWKPTKG